MKIKKLAIIILMTTFFIIFGTQVYATNGTIKDDTVNLVKQPNSKTILDYLYKGDEVEILDHESGWYKVKAQTSLGIVTGYVDEKLIDVVEKTEAETPKEEPKEESKENETIPTVESTLETETNIEEDKQYILTKEVAVNALPVINSRQKAKITGNITIIEIINDWAKIENDVESGWIRKNILKTSLTNEAKEEQQPVIETNANETTTEQNKIGYVSAEGLRVRKEPTTDSEEITSLSKNDQVKIIEQVDNWYKIDMNGEIGYVSSKYISDTKQPEVTSRSGSTLKNTANTFKKEETTVQENSSNQNQSESTENEQSTEKVTGTEVVEYAKQYLGYKYVSGGESPATGFDCSGFTKYVYKHFGISLYRTSKQQSQNGSAVAKSDLKPGDLVIFNNDSNTSIGHVGIYVGNGNFIHAANPSDGVKITTLDTGYYQKRYVGARRVI